MYDTAITLSEKIYDDGRLTQETEERTLRSIELYHDQKTGTITFSGRKGKDEQALVAHATAMGPIAIERGVNPEDIYVEPDSLDSVGQALFSKYIVARNGWNRLAVVSHAYHLPRLEELFPFIYGPNFGIAYIGVRSNKDNDPNIRETQLTSIEAFRRTFDRVRPGDTQAILEKLLEKHPLYDNGKFDNYRSFWAIRS